MYHVGAILPFPRYHTRRVSRITAKGFGIPICVNSARRPKGDTHERQSHLPSAWPATVGLIVTGLVVNRVARILVGR